MPTISIPLIGSFNPRGPVQAGVSTITTGKDQLFDNCVFDVVKNPVTGSAKVYVSRLRADIATSDSATTVSSPSVGGSWTTGSEIISSQFGITDWIFASFIGASTNVCGVFAQISGAATLYAIGETTGQITHMVETIISGVKTFLVTADDGTGWFFAQDSLTSNNTSVNVGITFTANTTSGSPTLSNVSSFSGRYVGQLISGTGIPAGTRISSMNSGASTITMTANATANGTGITVTAERIAKIIDADFPADIIGPFACIGGYNFITTSNGRLYNSDLNTIVSWTSGNFISTNFYPDNASGGAWVVGNRILCLSTDSGEWFYNAGNPSGSPLSPSTELNFNVGCASSTLVCRLNDEIYWMSSTSTGEVEIYTLRGATPTPIATDQLVSLISSGATNTVAGFMTQTLSAFRFAGNRYLSYKGYYVLDLDKGIWSIWSGNVSPLRCSGVRGGAPRNYEVSIAGEIYFIKNLTSNSPVIYKVSTDTTSSVDAETMTIRTSRLDLGTGNRKFVTYYELDTDIESQGPPLVTLEVSDDDFSTWTTIGTFDLRQMNPRIYRGGSWKGGRAHRLTMGNTTSAAFRASTLTINYEVGQH